MLERIKVNQLTHIRTENEKEEKDLEQVRAYKTQLSDLNHLRRTNERQLQEMKAANVKTEKELHELKKGNEKIARAVKAVKENPKLLDHAKSVNSIEEEMEMATQGALR